MDNFKIQIGRTGTLKGYVSVVSDTFDYSDIGFAHGIQTSKDCTEPYKNELLKRIKVLIEACNSIKELNDNYGFLNKETPERDISTLHERCIRDINSNMDIVSFENVEELEDSFSDIMSNKSHIKDYIIASLMLTGKGINVPSL